MRGCLQTRDKTECSSRGLWSYIQIKKPEGSPILSHPLQCKKWIKKIFFCSGKHEIISIKSSIIEAFFITALSCPYGPKLKIWADELSVISVVAYSIKGQHSMMEWKLLRKKGTPKILSKSISRMPMGSLVGH